MNSAMTININNFQQEKECTYKGERYSVRDNGAVMRHPKNTNKPRPLDNAWTFGKPNDKNGYMHISSARVHIIMTITFHGNPPTTQYIVDHIDTNRQNNRPKNLRWLTKLEHALYNPITRKRIIYRCGSIVAYRDEQQENGDYLPIPISNDTENINNKDLPHSLQIVTYEDNLFIHDRAVSGFYPKEALEEMYDNYTLKAE